MFLSAIPVFAHDTGTSSKGGNDAKSAKVERWCAEKKAQLEAKNEKKMSMSSIEEEMEMLKAKGAAKKSELEKMCAKKMAKASKVEKSKSKSKKK